MYVSVDQTNSCILYTTCPDMPLTAASSKLGMLIDSTVLLLTQRAHSFKAHHVLGDETKAVSTELEASSVIVPSITQLSCGNL